MSCEELLKQEAEGGCECSAEKASVSVYSPGVVACGEKLARNVFSPIHISAKTGEILPALFSDVATIGLSVDRLGYASEQDVADRGYLKQDRDRGNGKNRDYFGFITSVCGDIRSLNDEAGRLFCVFDTGKEDNEFHADVCQTKSNRTPADLKKIRKLIFRLFDQKPTLLGKSES
jgi:hypothetical protein